MTGASAEGGQCEDRPNTADPPRLSHLDQSGHARMVDVSGKDVTARQASASGRVLLSGQAVRALRAGEVPKGDALAVARIAGYALTALALLGTLWAVRRARERSAAAQAA